MEDVRSDTTAMMGMIMGAHLARIISIAAELVSLIC